jgi:hypothetical protein
MARIPALLGLSLAAAPSFAGTPAGSITFSPADTAAIPVIGNTMLVLLAAVLALIGIKTARRRGISPMVTGLVAGALVSVATGGAGLIETVRANGVSTVQITNASEETTQTFREPDLPINFENAAGAALIVTELRLPCTECLLLPSSEPPACEVGLRLEDQATCRVALAR